MLKGEMKKYEEYSKHYSYPEDGFSLATMYQRLQSEVALAKEKGFVIGAKVTIPPYRQSTGTIVEHAITIKDGFDAHGACTPLGVQWDGSQHVIFYSKEELEIVK